jgi:predicted DsbA family dithiol-disulfide isomerase
MRIACCIWLKVLLANDLEELLFKAYLTDGKNINDLDTLKALGLEVGLSESIDEVLHSNVYANEVQHDIDEAQSIGVQGVPFFVFDNKYAVSGATCRNFCENAKKVWEEGKFDSKLR